VIISSKKLLKLVLEILNTFFTKGVIRSRVFWPLSRSAGIQARFLSMKRRFSPPSRVVVQPMRWIYGLMDHLAHHTGWCNQHVVIGRPCTATLTNSKMDSYVFVAFAYPESGMSTRGAKVSGIDVHTCKSRTGSQHSWASPMIFDWMAAWKEGDGFLLFQWLLQ